MVSTEDLRARVQGRLWQAAAQVGLSAPAVPKETLAAFVSEATDGVLLELDNALEEVSAPAEPQPAVQGAREDEEQILWQGRPFLTLNERYVITSERVRIIRGLVARDREDLELVRIQNLEHSQTVGERLLKLGDVTIRSADPAHPRVTLRNVRDPEAVHEVLRRAVLGARKRSGLVFHEEF